MITLTREEAQQVLDALEESCFPRMSVKHSEAYDKAIETLRARLASERSEATEPEKSDSQKLRDAGYTKQERVNVLMVQVEDEPEKEQEPVAWMCSDPELIRTGFKQFTDVKNSIWNIPVYAAPPQQQNQFNPDWDAMAVMVEEQQRMAKQIEELEAALREKEPVAWADKYDIDREGHDFWVSRQRPAKYGVPLYAAPFSTPHSAAHSADSAGTFCNQEPVAWVQVAEDYYAHVVLLPNVDPINLDQQFLYTTPQREWQGLTDEEIEELASKCWFGGVSHGQEKFARAIEAKLKEKNA